ncbi:MAG: hypothetical protein M3Q24_00340 [bacterium]|nr:hypothetical protein [bacterium]
MKKIIIAMLALSFLGIPQGKVNAQGTVVITPLASSSQKVGSFEVNTKGIYKILNTNITRFDFETNEIADIEKIGYWKIRITCEENANVSAAGMMNHCGQALNFLPGQTPSAFSLFLTKSKDEDVKFSFKLKAYDKAGKWLNSEKKAFLW